MAQSVKHPTSAQVVLLQSVSLSPTSGSVLIAQSLEPASDSVSPSLSAPPQFTLCLSLSLSKINFKKILNLFLRQRETEHEQGRGRERERGTESEAGSRLWAVSTEPDVGLKLTDCEIRTWAEVRHSTDWATQAPLLQLLWNTSSLLQVWLLPKQKWRIFMYQRNSSV